MFAVAARVPEMTKESQAFFSYRLLPLGLTRALPGYLCSARKQPCWRWPKTSARVIRFAVQWIR